jgi:hypothetical protein
MRAAPRGHVATAASAVRRPRCIGRLLRNIPHTVIPSGGARCAFRIVLRSRGTLSFARSTRPAQSRRGCSLPGESHIARTCPVRTPAQKQYALTYCHPIVQRNKVLLAINRRPAVLRALRSALYGIGVYDAPTLVIVVAVLVSVSMAATAIPALRIARIDPAQTLREE